MSDREELSGYVAIWWQAVNDFVELLEELPEDEWATPTDLAGWDVRACAAHTAHLESILAGHPEETADVGQPAHVTSPMGLYTETGVGPAPTRSSTSCARWPRSGTPRCSPTRPPTVRHSRR